MNDPIASFVADMRARNLAPQTIRVYNGILRDFAGFLKHLDRPLEKVTRHELKAYLEHVSGQRGVSHKTASGYFGALCAFYDFLVYDDVIENNPVHAVRKRYLQTYKERRGHTHQIISIEDAARLVSSMVDIRDKAILMTLFKTGIRIKELTAIEVTDVDLQNMRITLKPTPKRTNHVVFFDEETADLLERWLKVRAYREENGDRWRWLGSRGGLKIGGLSKVVREGAKQIGLHDSSSPNMEDHFSPHCCRHWFTTMLDRAGMKREHIEMLRGDVGKGAIDLYIHNDLEDIKKEYLRCIPRLTV